MATFLSEPQCFDMHGISTYSLCGNDVFSPLLIKPPDTLDCDVVGFGGATCENDLPRICLDKVCHLLKIEEIYDVALAI